MPNQTQSTNPIEIPTPSCSSAPTTQSVNSLAVTPQQNSMFFRLYFRFILMQENFNDYSLFQKIASDKSSTSIFDFFDKAAEPNAVQENVVEEPNDAEAEVEVVQGAVRYEYVLEGTFQNKQEFEQYMAHEKCWEARNEKWS